MKTLYLPTSRNVRTRNISKAACLLHEGEVVAFPTETVYGLGASIFDPRAVRKIFHVKGRPHDNPLIVHLHSPEQVHALVSEIPILFWVLVRHFVPGPLTFVLKRSHAVPNAVTAGLPTIALRFPDHPVARALLKKAEVPVAAPSANLSGKPSPTRAIHVREDLDGRIAAILDGGDCRIGIESTVLDLTSRVPTVLRPGTVTQEALEEALRMKVRTAKPTSRRPASPGMKYRHYAPRAELIVLEGKPAKIVSAMRTLVRSIRKTRTVGVLAREQHGKIFKDAEFVSLGRSDPADAAHRLFAALREMDDRGVDVIVCEGFPAERIGAALMNRLRKAATKSIRV